MIKYKAYKGLTGDDIVCEYLLKETTPTYYILEYLATHNVNTGISEVHTNITIEIPIADNELFDSQEDALDALRREIFKLSKDRRKL